MGKTDAENVRYLLCWQAGLSERRGSAQVKMARIFAISDLHVDYVENMYFIERLSFTKFNNDVLLVAGDVTHDVSRLKSVLLLLKKKFKEVVFVPGNHDIWIREANCWETSIDKFHRILRICKSIDVKTDPFRVTLIDKTGVWIVPLFSWYTTPEEDRDDSLYVYVAATPNTEDSNDMWMDFHWCEWPDDMTGTPAKNFAELNSGRCSKEYEGTVITLSHMLPRQELIKGGTYTKGYMDGPSVFHWCEWLDDMTEAPAKYFADLNSGRCSKEYESTVVTLSHMLPRQELIKAEASDLQRIAHERKKRGLSSAIRHQGAAKGFDFTRFAGSRAIDKQIRQVNSKLHVYGHQHRNRDRTIDGVRYVSHCLGSYPEQQKGLIAGVDYWKGPKQILPAVSDEMIKVD